MATEIKMPQLSDTMSSGKILVWRKKEGEAVARGDILAEVETDKANLEIESFGAGVLLKIATPAGSSAKVGEVIAHIGQAGEKIEGTSAASAPVPSAPAKSPAPAPVSTPASAPSHSTQTAIMMSAQAHSQDASGRIKASPLARKIARDKNIDLTLVSGTGPAGRIIRRDIEAAMVEKSTSRAAAPAHQMAPVMMHSSAAVATPMPAARPEGVATTGGRLTPLSKMRETIARRMQESVTQQPHFYVTASINMMEAKKLREALKEAPGYQGVSFNHLIIKAAAYGLSKEPRVNRAIKDGMVYEPASINIGIITAIEDGLIIPVLHQTDKMALKDVIFEARAAVERARAGRPTAQDLSGGTFSISNMGMFDVDSFTAIINPGQGGVLAVSAIKEEPVVYQGAVVPGLTMKATVSVDHRVIDGVMAGNFLKHFKQALEVPALLMM